MSGMAAAIFAVNKGLSVMQISHHSALINHSGVIDLMSCAPLHTSKIWKNPLKGIQYLTGRNPDHPYAKLDLEEIKGSIAEIKAVLNSRGLKYTGSLNQNLSVLTSLGTLKKTCLIPATIWPGVKAQNQKKPGLVIDIRGLRGFSARQIIETAKSDWPNLQTARISFPGMENFPREAVPELLARHLENSTTLKAFGDKIKPLVKKAEAVGLPAILGINPVSKVHKNLVKMLGVPVFEIPSMPPSVPGMRLKETFESILQDEGVVCFNNRKVETVSRQPNGRFLTGFDNIAERVNINTGSLVLASGRFTSQGLKAENGGIRESILNLPVDQPALKTEWYQSRFFNKRGHAINRTGIATDRFLRPLKLRPEVYYDNLFAIGSIMAYQDWVREKSGSGMAIASAFKAIQGVKKFRKVDL